MKNLRRKSLRRVKRSKRRTMRRKLNKRGGATPIRMLVYGIAPHGSNTFKQKVFEGLSPDLTINQFVDMIKTDDVFKGDFYPNNPATGAPGYSSFKLEYRNKDDPTRLERLYPGSRGNENLLDFIRTNALYSDHVNLYGIKISEELS
jgi:hypothetical protein